MKFPNAEGLRTSSTHLDEDNDKISYYYYVLQCGEHVASVIGFHDQYGESTYPTMQKTILESLKESKKANIKLEAGAGR